MKFSALLFLVWFTIFSSYSQTFTSLQTFGSNETDFATAVAADQNGNYFITGSFQETVDFDPSSTVNSLTSNDSLDLFVAKFDFNDNLVWIKHISNSDNYVQAVGIEVDNQGNVIIAGRFNGSIDMDPSSAFTFLNSGGDRDGFILKLDSNGTYLWAYQLEGAVSSEIFPLNLKIDNSNNIYVSGLSRGSINYRSEPGNPLSISGEHGFIVRLTSDGRFNWLNFFRGGVWVYDIAIDSKGDVFAHGSFDGEVDFDASTSQFKLTSFRGRSLFILKINSSGGFLFAKRFDDTESLPYGRTIEVDNKDNVVIGGVYRGILDADPNTTTYDLPRSDNHRIYIIKLNNNADFIWARHYENNNFDNTPSFPTNSFLYDISIDAFNNIYSCGYFKDKLDFSPPLNRDTIYAGNKTNSFVLKLNSNGNIQDIIQLKSDSSVRVFALALSGQNAYVSGRFYGSIEYSPENLRKTSNGESDAFSFKIALCDPVFSAQRVLACNDYISPSGKYKWTTTGRYYDTLLNKSGCDSIIDIQLTVNYVDTSVIFIDSGYVSVLNNATYRWLDCNNNSIAIPNATNQTFVPSYNSTFSVEVTKNGCTDTSECFVFVGGVENLLQRAKLYPNPTTNKLFLTNINGLEIKEILVYTTDGKLSNSIQPQTNLQQSEIILPAAEGIYIVELISSDGKSIRKKIVKI